jgi:acyl CoA:acetate/3-ketoacid CoA transferase
VFRLVENGIELIETAPGVDVRKDILEKMAFRPQISSRLKEMPEEFFRRG